MTIKYSYLSESFQECCNFIKEGSQVYVISRSVYIETDPLFIGKC